MITYTLVIKPSVMIMQPGKVKKARKFMQADGLEFYVLGQVAKRRDSAINLCLNKAIEHGYRAAKVYWW